MVELGVTAKLEKDVRLLSMKREVTELVKTRVSHQAVVSSFEPTLDIELFCDVTRLWSLWSWVATSGGVLYGLSPLSSCPRAARNFSLNLYGAFAMYMRNHDEGDMSGLFICLLRMPSSVMVRPTIFSRLQAQEM